jgi:hypothetical protein
MKTRIILAIEVADLSLWLFIQQRFALLGKSILLMDILGD